MIETEAEEREFYAIHPELKRNRKDKEKEKPSTENSRQGTNSGQQISPEPDNEQERSYVPDRDELFLSASEGTQHIPNQPRHCLTHPTFNQKEGKRFTYEYAYNHTHTHTHTHRHTHIHRHKEEEN